LDEIKKRPFIAEILKQNIFERFIELQRSKSGKRSYKVLDAAGVPIFLGEGVNPHV
jgi:stage III sporulation protein AA